MKNDTVAISWVKGGVYERFKLGVSQDCMNIVAVRFIQNVYCQQALLENNPSTNEISICLL